MTKKLNIFVSVVLVSDRSTVDITKRVIKISKLLKSNYANYELIVIDNGIVDTSFDKLKSVLRKVPCIRIIRLAKSLDIDTAIFAGIESSIGDYICVFYNNDPIEMIPEFIKENQKNDIVFGLATNIRRKNFVENWGAKIFYWYNRKYLGIDIPFGSTFYMSFNRNVANALTRSNRQVRHIRHLAKQVGYSPVNLEYKINEGDNPYVNTPNRKLLTKAINLLSSYSSHPLRVVSYFGLMASGLNIIYAIFVVIVNLTSNDVEKGWTTLSLQSSIMFFLLFLILAMIAEYVGKILVETRNEPPYHIMQELSSTISLADETRRNVEK
jgi:glycosyltransferase involved in cell wall biosynthesis